MVSLSHPLPGIASLTSSAGALALAGILAALPFGQARAQQNQMLPSIVVTPSTIPTSIEKIGSSVSVVTGEDISRNQWRTVTDILNTLPGLNVVQNGSAGTQTSVFMRGTNSNQVKVLIDGVDASDPSSPGGAFDFGQLSAADIERLEVLRGPQSGLYGSDAIGGVISIVTKKGSGPAKVTGWAEGGSFGTFNQAAGLSGGEERFNYAFNVAHMRSTKMEVTPDYMVPPGGRKFDNAWDNWTYSGRIGVDLSENLALNFTGRYVEGRTDYTGDAFSFPVVTNSAQSFSGNESFVGRAEAVATLFDGKFVNTFGANLTDYSRLNRDPGPSGLTTFDGQREAYDWRGKLFLAPGHALVMGLEAEEDRSKSGGAEVSNAQVGNKAGYVELQSGFLNHIFIVANARHDDNDAFGGHNTWRVTPSFIVPGTETKLKGSYGTGFSAPSLQQLYGPWGGNPNLKPEESTGYDIGFEQPLWDNSVRLGATYYRNDITNLINSVCDPDWNCLNENVGKAVTFGAEAFVTWRVNDRLQLRGDYTQTIARNAITNQPLLRRPKDKYAAQLIWKPLDALTVSTTLVYLGTWTDIDRQTYETTTRGRDAIVNIALNYEVNESLTMFGRVDNLFDEQYENPAGWDQPGLGVYAGLRMRN